MVCGLINFAIGRMHSMCNRIFLKGASRKGEGDPHPPRGVAKKHPKVSNSHPNPPVPENTSSRTPLRNPRRVNFNNVMTADKSPPAPAKHPWTHLIWLWYSVSCSSTHLIGGCYTCLAPPGYSSLVFAILVWGSYFGLLRAHSTLTLGVYSLVILILPIVLVS